MRCENMKVQFAFQFPYDKPDKNGVIYTKEAVEQAISSLQGNLPILYQDNKTCIDGVVLGNTVGETSSALWDDEAQICEVVVNGVVYFGGTDCFVKEIEDGVVTSFEITSVGLSR